MKIARVRDLVKQLIATVLVAVLPLLLQPAVAQTFASVEGTVFAGAEGRALEGARVHLVDRVTSAAYSATTSADGSFAIEGVPAATYDSGIEFQGGLYVVEESVVVAPGMSHGVNFSVPHMAKKAKPKSPAAPAKSGKPSFLKGPLATALVVVGAAFAVGLVVDNVSNDSDDASDDASPFTD